MPRRMLPLPESWTMGCMSEGMCNYYRRCWWMGPCNPKEGAAATGSGGRTTPIVEGHRRSQTHLQELLGSVTCRWQQNLLTGQQRWPTHYHPVVVPVIPQHSPLLQLDDPWISSLVTHGADLPPPQDAPRVFQKTQALALMDQVIQDYVMQGILREQQISTAYRSFLVAKTDGSARFVMDLSPLTPHYRVPQCGTGPRQHSALGYYGQVWPSVRILSDSSPTGALQVLWYILPG
jgi:hypothetical protein